MRPMLALLAAATAAGSGDALVPRPARATTGTVTLPLAAAFRVRQAASWQRPSPVLAAAIARTEAIVFAHGGGGGGGQSRPVESDQPELQTLVINVTVNDFGRPQLGGDESYTLQIGGDGPGGAGSSATLTAPSINGALHGLQTFAQLCRYDYDGDTVVIDHTPWQIDDRPRFSHRGLMLDTARHFYPPRAIVQLLDAMAAVKLSVFHWHL
jgi:hexosaminidase